MGDPLSNVKELAANECWDRLRASLIGRLAVVVDGHPDIFPVNFVVDHGTVVFRTAPGTKLDSALAGEPVAFEVDGSDARTGRAWSVVIKSTPQRLQSIDDVLESALLPLYPWQSGVKNYFVRLLPFDLTGRDFPITPEGLRAVRHTHPSGIE